MMRLRTAVYSYNTDSVLFFENYGSSISSHATYMGMLGKRSR
jgi:hypothetical protein